MSGTGQAMGTRWGQTLLHRAYQQAPLQTRPSSRASMWPNNGDDGNHGPSALGKAAACTTEPRTEPRATCGPQEEPGFCSDGGGQANPEMVGGVQEDLMRTGSPQAHCTVQLCCQPGLCHFFLVPQRPHPSSKPGLQAALKCREYC